MEEVRGSSPLSPTILATLRVLLAGAVLVCGAWSEASVFFMDGPRLISKEKSHWPIDETTVRGWLVDRRDAVARGLGASQTTRRFLMEYADVTGRQDVELGTRLGRREVIVVNVPVVEHGQPWTVRHGQVFVDGRRRIVEESEGTWRRREERVEGKRVVHTDVKGTSTTRQLDPGALEPVPWDDVGEPARTLTLWVDREGRIYAP